MAENSPTRAKHKSTYRFKEMGKYQHNNPKVIHTHTDHNQNTQTEDKEVIQKATREGKRDPKGNRIQLTADFSPETSGAR